MDPVSLAKQLRKPEGEAGRKVGEVMAERTAPLNDFAIDCLGIEPEDHVLEIGFGPGNGIREACRLTPRGFVAGVDFSEEMLKMAQERCARELIEERAELTIADASSLPFDDASFDKAFSVNVAHFWARPAVELSEIRRVLKPGGRLVLFLTHHASWPPGLKETGVFVAREPGEWEGIVREAGFTDVRSMSRAFGGLPRVGEPNVLDEVKGFCVIATA